MNKKIHDILNKESKIAILGMGIEGIAIKDYLKKHGYLNLTLCDQKNDLAIYSHDFSLKTGEKAFKDLSEFDVIFRSPGIHKDHTEILKARKNGAIITSATKIFFEICPCEIVGISGTKGKGTTSSLIYEILKAAGRDVYLGGNIGESPLTFADDLNEKSIAILEMSSFQLHDLDQSPHIAILLNTTQDHLDYHADIDEYLSAKKSIVSHQKKEDFAIFNSDYSYAKDYSGLTSAKTLWVSRKQIGIEGGYLDGDKIMLNINGDKHVIGDKNNVGLIGPHNIENILPASLACKILGVNDGIISKTIKNFKGLPHRLEFIKKVDGASYYNDSFSTTPETCIAAIRSFSEPLILIAGGSEKYSNFTELGQAIIEQENLKTVILMGETSPRIFASIQEAYGKTNLDSLPVEIIRVNNYEEAFNLAHQKAKNNSVVLLSPASASFDMFENYKVRGKTFIKWVESL
ncbi:UDP-N-acetylmuramoyl-L-alanine--D-glutamate ligase [Patescibacteria group bacterium]|nr:UDP-N-acetylmuramoyl-L-alanine--D-glutamate ligase [Patescibacteria group bacterium]